MSAYNNWTSGISTTLSACTFPTSSSVTHGGTNDETSQSEGSFITTILSDKELLRDALKSILSTYVYQCSLICGFIRESESIYLLHKYEIYKSVQIPKTEFHAMHSLIFQKISQHRSSMTLDLYIDICLPALANSICKRRKCEFSPYDLYRILLSLSLVENQKISYTRTKYDGMKEIMRLFTITSREYTSKARGLKTRKSKQ
ncbi:unnamed protein product [Trichobilharzia regenti]|uniref:P27 n=1 Tax=Trichobilharzia regenti TaxID=157069 RepID=A0A183W9Z6_TRIRE|nr:unnamed protein product [Trichobilharzia regenti]VDQ04828.1 unnamed protein product [Trichobilharzia regenti]